MDDPNFSEDELLHFERLLQAQKSNLTRASQRSIDQMMEDDERGGDSLDRTTAEQRKSTELRLKDRELRRLFDIEAALERLKNATFGICENCDEPIAAQRLLANPTARLCLDCQEEHDEHEKRRRFRPGLLDDPHRF